MTAKDEVFIFSMRMSPMDRQILEGLCSFLSMSSSDIMKCALYEFAVVQKSPLFKASLKELARLKQLDFKMQVMKEIEHITHKQAFYIDGFMNLMKIYHSKYVPIDVVRRYVTIKIISLYTLYSTGQRKEFVAYIRKHFLHFYPNEKAWLDKQLKYIRTMKKGEKDELLTKLARNLPKVQEAKASLGMRENKKDAVLEMPANGAEEQDAERKGKK